jgi:hypothetical protein
MEDSYAGQRPAISELAGIFFSATDHARTQFSQEETSDLLTFVASRENSRR